jgi:DME family drug/metabolite transporter
MDPVRAARFRLLAAAAIFSTGGAAIKACGLAPWQVVAFRSGIGALAILTMAPDARRGWTAKTPLVGLAYAATVVLFVLSNRLTTSANAIFLQSTAPLYLLLVGPWLLKEPIHASDWPFMAALGAGMTLFFVGVEPSRATAPNPALGNVLALASGLTWALTIAGLRSLGKSGGSAAAATVAGNVIACVVALPFALPVGETTSTDWLLVSFLGVVQIGLAYALLTRSSKHVGALEATLLLLLEPVLNPIWSWIAHGETPGPWSLAGGAVILAATVMRARSGTSANDAPPQPSPD